MSFKFNPFTGKLDVVNGAAGGVDNFSYKLIESNETIEIPVNQQMLIDGKLTIRGQLNIRGSLKAFPEKQNEFSIKNINRQVIIPSDEQMIVKGTLKIRATTYIRGSLALVSGEKLNYLDGSALPPYYIESGKSITVPSKKVYNIYRLTKIRGSIISRGLIVAR